MPKPVDPLSDTMYDMTSLNRLFFVSCILLLGIVVWMTWQDYDRNWKNYQRDFNKIALGRAEKELARANSLVDSQQLAELTNQLAAVRKEIEGKEGEIEKLREQREENRGPMEKSLQKWQFMKSELDTAKQQTEKALDDYNHEKHHADEIRAKEPEKAASLEAHLPGLKSNYEDKLAKYKEMDAETTKAKLDYEVHAAKDVELAAKLNEIVSKEEVVQKEIDRLRKDAIAIERRIEKLKPNLAYHLLQMPGADFVANPLQIDQIRLPWFQEDLNFSSVEKIDRCRTCHLAIDRKGWTDKELPAVFRSHPNLDLYVSDGSPHPVGQFGCTICHGGQGRSVDFRTAAHMPSDAAESKQWEEKYGWKPVAHFDNPMLPSPYIEASCTKCHSTQHRVTGGERVNEGKRLLESVGCYGCHPIAGTEDLRKPGPSLLGLKFKATKDWAFHWISKPSDFRPTTKMPQPFHLSNTSGEDDKKKNNAMIAAIVEYLFTTSELAHVQGAAYPAPPAGDAAKGKAMFDSVGCIACHVAGDESDKGTEYTSFGPNLSSVGSKLNAGWVYAWIRDPKQYFPQTSMPDLRLTETEAADITAYLMTQKHSGKFEDRKMPDVPIEDLRNTLKEFLLSSLPTKQAEDTVNAMDRPTVFRELGNKAVGHMGCFGCHDVKGFEKTKKIGAELTGANATGSKDITKFDFGFRHDLLKTHHPGAHDRIAWVSAKLEDPRTFDAGRIIPYPDRLRMPLFNLTPEQRDAVTTYVMSFRTRENIPPSHQRVLNHEDWVVNAGKRLADQSNCASCHKVGQFPTYVTIGTDEDSRIALRQQVVFSPYNILSDGRSVAKISADELRILEKKGVTLIVPAGKWLKDADIEAIQAAFSTSDPNIPIRFLVGAYGEGAIAGKLNKTPDDNNAPPIVFGEGARVNPDWLFRFLKQPFEIRPWLTKGGIRMPTFGFTDDEAEILTHHFAVLSKERYPYQFDTPPAGDVRARLIEKGRQVFERNECGKCHPAAGSTVSAKNPAPPFERVAPRIQKDWFHLWIRDPASMQPGTAMPPYSMEQVKPDEEEALREFIWSLHEKK